MNEALFAEPTISQPLPHSLEAEQAVLGGLMLKNDAFDSVAEVLGEKSWINRISKHSNLIQDSRLLEALQS